jgi:hypothetical protein
MDHGAPPRASEPFANVEQTFKTIASFTITRVP